MVTLRLFSTALLATAASALACNVLLDIDVPNIIESSECVLTTDCREGYVCLFRVCSPPCRGDADCDEGARCLASGEDTACVGARARCGGDEDEPCPEGTACVGGSCRIECEPSEEDDSPCLDGQVCADGVCVGTDATRDPAGGSCDPGETRCTSEGAQQTCSQAKVWGAAHDCPFVCRDGVCAGECVPGDERCDGDGVTRRECDDSGEWRELEQCPAVCSEGSCEETCEVDARQCASGDVLLRCGDEGVWVTEETCEFVCAAEARACAGECETNARSCAGDALRVCDAAGTWETLDECAGACIALGSAQGGHACVDCEPGAERCAGNEVQSCSESGAWQSEADCTDLGQTCLVSDGEASCGGDCAQGEVACDGADVVTCDGGTYVTLMACDTPAEICRDGACEANEPYDVGYSESDGWTSFTALSNRIYAVPVTVPRRATLQSLRLAGAGAGVSAVMALYEDDGDRPGERLAGTSAFNVGAMTNVALPLSAVTLEANQTYWATVIFSANVSFQQKVGSGYVATTTFPTIPDSFPAGSAEQEVNVWRIYLRVVDASE